MNSRFLFCILAGLMAAPQAMLAHDPHDPMVTVAVSPNYAQDHTVLVATDFLSVKIGAYALLKSTDGGVNWSVVAGLPNNNRMDSIAFSPAYSQDQTIVIAGSGGLYLTANQGASWSLLFQNPLFDVALSPNFATDNTLFVITSQGKLYKSNNRGQSWTSLPVPSAGPSVIAVSPNYAVDTTLLLGTGANGIFKSTNSGGSWVQVTTVTLPKVTALTFSPGFSSDQTAFAATFGAGMLVSTSGGSSWMFSNSGIADRRVTSIALSLTYLQDSTLWISSATAGILQSKTNGASWTAQPTVSRTLSNLSATHYQDIILGGSSAAPVFYLAMYEGLWTSSTGASSWQYIDTLPTRLTRHINVSPNYANDQTVFVSTYGSGNLWTVNGGSSWTVQDTGMQRPYTDASGISSNFAKDGTAFSSNDQGLQRTTNRALTWQLLHGLGVHTYPRALAVSPVFAQDSTVLIGLAPASSTNTGVYLSTDGGNTWQNTSLTGVAPVVSIAMSPAFATDRTAFAASDTNGLYKSADGGMTWSPTASSLTTEIAIVAVSPSFATDGTVFAAGLTGGVFQSTDRGTTWSTLPQTSSLRALDLQISPNYAADQTFFAGTIQEGLVKFTKDGAVMSPVTSFPDQFVTAVGISPSFASDSTLFAAAYHGVYKSTDGGSTWSYLSVPARVEESQNVAGPLQEPPAITYQGAWSVLMQGSASCDASELTGTSQDSLTLNFTGTGVGWVTLIGPQQGSASITLDSVPQTTVSLTAAMNHYQHLVWQKTGLTCGLHTLTITALPQSGQTVSLDAFNVYVDSCPVN